MLSSASSSSCAAAEVGSQSLPAPLTPAWCDIDQAQSEFELHAPSSACPSPPLFTRVRRSSKSTGAVDTPVCGVARALESADIIAHLRQAGERAGRRVGVVATAGTPEGAESSPDAPQPGTIDGPPPLPPNGTRHRPADRQDAMPDHTPRTLTQRAQPSAMNEEPSHGPRGHRRA